MSNLSNYHPLFHKALGVILDLDQRSFLPDRQIRKDAWLEYLKSDDEANTDIIDVPVETIERFGQDAEQFAESEASFEEDFSEREQDNLLDF